MVWQEDRRGPYVWSCGVGDSKTTEELFIKNFEIDQQWMFYVLRGNSVRSIISAKAKYFLRKRQRKFKELAIKDRLMRTWMVAVHTSPVPSSLSCFPPISSSWTTGASLCCHSPLGFPSPSRGHSELKKLLVVTSPLLCWRSTILVCPEIGL